MCRASQSIKITRMQKFFSRKNIDETAGAVSGLSGAVAFGLGVAVKLLAPSGLAVVLAAVGLQSPSLLMRVAPVVLLFCTVVGVLAGLIRFVSWLVGKLTKA